MDTYSLLECPLAARDYAYYKSQFATLQAESDAFDEEFGFVKIDRAYVKTVERARHRAFRAAGNTFTSGLARWREEQAAANASAAAGATAIRENGQVVAVTELVAA